ncbi:MAG: hypothetical protein NTX42_02245 [Methanothrix sp.]|nr:hypothetical protein [Methanothrix sp.]
MDHVVHINNGGGAAKPIVLRLLPGEETIFNLKVVNHGEPSNISLQASSPVLKAVHLKKPDHYVVQEEIIPILARMPANKKRLDGEILLCGRGGESRVPITLLRDSEDPGDDLEDPGLQGDEELKDEEVDEEDEDADLARKRDGGDREETEDEDEDEEESLVIRRVKRSDDEDDDEDGDEEKEKEPRRIAFSRDKDLQRYRSATRQQRAGGIERSKEKRGQKPAGSRVDKDRRDAEVVENRYDEDDNNSRVETRFKARIDDRFVDPSNRQDEGPRFVPRKVPLGGQEEKKEEWKEEGQRFNSGYEEDRYQGFREIDSESREEIPTSASASAVEREQRSEERAPEEPEVYVEPDEEPESIYLDRLDAFGGLGALKIIPAALFLALVIVLVLTFITESIPEFPGALASSIMIVTLIIYGAATLLKA